MSTGERITGFRHDGLEFEVTDSGPSDGEIVVCLHGFPQPASSWDKVTERLTGAGHRVLAPTQRGYSAGARPRRRRDYAIERLVGDTVALIDAVGAERVHLVGHDWGAAVVWQVAADHPERLATMTAVSTPHPGALARSMVRSSQLFQSWYMLAFQVPWVPEKALARSGPARARDMLVRDGLSEQAATEAAELLTDPDTARGMIGWYRGLVHAGLRPTGPIDVPCVYIWSDRDRYLGRWPAERTADWVTGPYRFVEITDGTHWLPDTHPGRIADAVAAIASEYPTG